MKSRLSNTLIALTVAIFTLTTSPLASPGGEKSEAEKQAELLQKATHEYNKGVEKLAKAKEYEQSSDSLFAYNYRATNNAKARKEYENAVKHYDKALKLNPKMHESHSDRGYCLRKLGLIKESLKAYNTALKLAPNYGPALEYRGEAHLANGDLAAAQKDLETLDKLATSKDPDKDEFARLAATLKAAIEKFRLEHFTESDSL